MFNELPLCLLEQGCLHVPYKPIGVPVCRVAHDQEVRLNMPGLRKRPAVHVDVQGAHNVNVGVTLASPIHDQKGIEMLFLRGLNRPRVVL